MEALFIGQTYIDVTFLAERIPVGDEKAVASEYAVSFGGNAVTAAFCCAKLGIRPDLIATCANDWLGRMFQDMADRYDIELHIRKVARSSLSFVRPHKGKRAILRGRDDRHPHPLPPPPPPAPPPRRPPPPPRRPPARRRDALRAALPPVRHHDVPRRRGCAHQYARAALLHRHRHRGGAVLRADESLAAGHARLPE